jgi:hypothetical protein
MAEDKLRQFEAILGAVSKITSDEVDGELVGARCPRCDASNFAQVMDLYSAARDRIADDPTQEDAKVEGGMTNAQMMRKFAPPQRKSPMLRVILTAIVFGVPAYFIHQRFGETAGQFAYMATAVAAVISLLTGLRRYSGEYYDARKRWRHLYMCRKCGQLVAP